jgi:hypothetical protein
VSYGGHFEALGYIVGSLFIPLLCALSAGTQTQATTLPFIVTYVQHGG